MLRNSMGSGAMLTEFLNAHTDDASFFFSSPTVTLLTQGIAAEFTQQVRFSELDTHISQLLESAKEEGNENRLPLV